MKPMNGAVKIKLEGQGENVLAQKILFEKGYAWGGGMQQVLYAKDGQCLYIRPPNETRRRGSIRRSDLDSRHFDTETNHSPIGWKELMAL